MKEIQISFNLYQSKFPFIGDYVCLYECLKNKKYSNSIITKAFNKLVKDTVLKGRERQTYLNHLLK